ncbi:MAG: PAS domain S-box protein, partial [Halofilum sp. (in: g-proteobacteria)]
MRLSRLSTASIVGCTIGLLALLAFGAVAHHHMREKQEQMGRLLELQKRLDDFSAGSDSLLLFPADQPLQRAFRADAEALRQQLRSMDEGYPAAETAAREIGLIIEALEEAGAFTPEGTDASSRADAGGPLDIPQRARIITNQVASQGVALDTALDRLLRERQQTIATEATWIAGSFAGAALLFAALSLMAFGLIHRRIGAPVQKLATTIDRIRAGESGLRADSSGDSELSRLAGAFNRLLDERDAADARIAEQQRLVLERERMLDHSQHIARVGSWRFDLSTHRLEWSAETFRIAGLPVGEEPPDPEGWFRFVHPGDRAHLLAVRERALQEGHRHDVEFRLVRADGSIRHVHELGDIERDASGNAIALAGSIQDVTERYSYEQRLEQYRDLIESGSDLYCVIDADHRYVLANDAYAALYGLSAGTIEGCHLLDVLSRDFYEREAAPRIDRCLAGESLSFEGERSYPHLGTRQLLIRYFPIASSDGTDRNIGAVMTDITGIRQAEERLREQARMLDIAGRVARLGGWLVDMDEGVIRWSDMVAAIHGMPQGWSPTVEEDLAFYAPEYREVMHARFSACAEQGIAYDEEAQILNAHGERVWIHEVAEPVRDERGRIYRVQGAFQDISVYKAADLELERLNARLADVLESITDAFLTVDHDWIFRYVNTEAGRIMGRSPETLVGC